MYAAPTGRGADRTGTRLPRSDRAAAEAAQSASNRSVRGGLSADRLIGSPDRFQFTLRTGSHKATMVDKVTHSSRM